MQGQTLILNKTFPEFFSDSVKKKLTACANKNVHWYVNKQHVQGHTLILNKTFPEFFSEALRKTRSMCKQKRSLVCKQTAHAGTDLLLT